MVIVNLLNRNPQKGKRPEVSDIMPFIGARFFIELDMAHKDNERLTKEINRQRNNAVLFRVLVKLCSICERPTISGKSVSNYLEMWGIFLSYTAQMVDNIANFFKMFLQQSKNPWSFPSRSSRILNLG